MIFPVGYMIQKFPPAAGSEIAYPVFINITDRRITFNITYLSNRANIAAVTVRCHDVYLRNSIKINLWDVIIKYKMDIKKICQILIFRLFLPYACRHGINGCSCIYDFNVPHK